MPLTREERKLLHQKSKQPTFGSGKPDDKEGKDGDISFRQVEESGTVEYVKTNNEWVAVASSGAMPASRVGSGAFSTSASGVIRDHGNLRGLGDDDHTQYILHDGTRAFTGSVKVGYDDVGQDVTFFGATSGKKLFWDESADTLFLPATVDIDGTVTVGVNDTGYDVKLFGATSGKYMLWDESADTLVISGQIDFNSQGSGENIAGDGTNLTITSGVSGKVIATPILHVGSPPVLSIASDGVSLRIGAPTTGQHLTSGEADLKHNYTIIAMYSIQVFNNASGDNYYNTGFASL